MYTGRLFEYDVLGKGTQLITKVDVIEYKSYNKAMEEVMLTVDASTWDATDPDSNIGNDLHANIAIAKGLEDWFELRFYPAIGSSFDIHHGVDCFFVLNNKVVTIDLTLNSNKDSYKADVIVTPDMLEGDMFSATSEICAAFN